MSYIGTVTQGMVVLPPEVKLEEGARVRVEPLPAEPPAKTLGERLIRIYSVTLRFWAHHTGAR
jgi:hypothetical protein